MEWPPWCGHIHIVHPAVHTLTHCESVFFSVSISLSLSLCLTGRATAGDALWHLPHAETEHRRRPVFFFFSPSFRCLGPRLSPRLSHAVHADISTANILTSLPSCSVFRVPLPSSAVHTVAGTVPSAALTTDSAVPRSRSNKGPKGPGRRLGCAGVVGVGWACIGVGIKCG